MCPNRCDTDGMFWSPYPRDVVQVAGPDAATFLHSQLSQEIRPLAVGESAWSFLLQPTGKIEVLLRIQRVGEESFVLDTDVGFGDAMVARLNRFKIRVKVEISKLAWICIAVRGEGAAAVTGGLASWGDGVDLLGEAPAAPQGAVAGSADDLLAARIEASWPAMGSEITPGETIPGETGVVAVAVNFTKGCYPGQELVERMDSRGASAPKSLQRVTVPVGTVVGDDYTIDGKAAGVVTSVHGETALAMVKRSMVAH
jgi:tRNA-modifying protein YgfZ